MYNYRLIFSAALKNALNSCRGSTEEQHIALWDIRTGVGARRVTEK